MSSTNKDLKKQAALNLIRRLPPQQLEESLQNIVAIAPQLDQALAAHVTGPLQVEEDPVDGRCFIASPFNCINGSFRSPWTNTYFPQGQGTKADEENMTKPQERLRRLEEAFNDIFDIYTTSYHDGGVSSVYLWDIDVGFAGAFLVHKEIQLSAAEISFWDATHVVEVKELTGSNAVEYRLWSQILLHMKQVASDGKKGSSSSSEVATLLNKQREEKHKKAGEDAHILHIGRMIEEVETSIRQNIENIYVAKHREVLAAVRASGD